jgi:Rieske Fe-S protein
MLTPSGDLPREEPGLTRRAFERFTLVLVPVAYALGIAAAVVRYLIPVPSRRLPRLDVGPKERFSPGKAEGVVFNGRLIYVLHDGTALRALDATCTHLSCRVDWSEGDRTFKCHCHGGLFSAKGELLGGPPDGPLHQQAFEVTPEGRVVLLDRSA